MPVTYPMPGISTKYLLGTVLDEKSSSASASPSRANRRQQQLGMLSGGREPVQVPLAPQEGRFGMPFTVCISNICRAARWPLSWVLVLNMGRWRRPDRCAVTLYV